MKKALWSAVIAILSVAFAWTETKSSDATKKLEGTWELASAERGQTHGKLPEGMKQIKLISSQHFVWVYYDVAKMKPLYTGGGTYTLTGNSYTEHVDYMNVEGAEKITGKDQPFTIRLEGDTLTQSGTMSDGQKISETWKRVD
ncbi:MAG: hypothetical protein ACJ746_12080 [Bryobacteraceae bacterium]